MFDCAPDGGTLPAWPLHDGDMRDLLPRFADATFDAVVTDPPYELGFMGQRWDATGIAFRPETWAGLLRALKPGAHLLAFGGSRTFHRIAVAIEDAGLEMRDTLLWLYGGGMPEAGYVRDRDGEKGGGTSGAWWHSTGWDVVRAYMKHVMDNAEESVRRVIDRIGNGSFTTAWTTDPRSRSQCPWIMLNGLQWWISPGRDRNGLTTSTRLPQ